jgi:two-component system response regulator RstA
MNKTVTLVEDDKKMAQLLKEYFEQFGFFVEVNSSGKTAAQRIIETSPSIAIIDLMLPDRDGLSICRDIRDKYQGKILILTASGDDMDQVAALEMGADDFVFKPINPRVLLARVRMLLRRKSTTDASQHSDIDCKVMLDEERDILQFGQLWINKTLQRCTLNGEVVPVTPSEITILWCLANQPKKTLSREFLLKTISKLEYDGLNRTVDNNIAQLRKKLKDDVGNPKGIITVRGKGYIFIPDYW